jgi:hypothetical protein
VVACCKWHSARIDLAFLDPKTNRCEHLVDFAEVLLWWHPVRGTV